MVVSYSTSEKSRLCIQVIEMFINIWKYVSVQTPINIWTIVRFAFEKVSQNNT